MTYYRSKYGYEPAAFPEAARISDGSIALPVGPHVGRDDMDYVAQTVRAAIEEQP
jgi:dTDP-4-amino-4,6-dideoxygalactose transaminase